MDFADFDFALGADKLLDFEGGDHPQPTAAAPWTRLASVRWHRIAAETSSRWPMSSVALVAPISVGEEDCDRPSEGSTTHNVEEEPVMDALPRVRGVADPDPSESWLDWLETSLCVFELHDLMLAASSSASLALACDDAPPMPKDCVAMQRQVS